MYLKFYANDSQGVQVMKTINMHCKNISQIQSGAYFTGCIPRSADSSLVAIQQKMSELLDKCMYKLGYILKIIFWGLCKPTRKVG